MQVVSRSIFLDHLKSLNQPVWAWGLPHSHDMTYNSPGKPQSYENGAVGSTSRNHLINRVQLEFQTAFQPSTATKFVAMQRSKATYMDQQQQKWKGNHDTKSNMEKEKELHPTSPTIASTAKHATTFQESNTHKKTILNMRYLQPGNRTLSTPTT